MDSIVMCRTFIAGLIHPFIRMITIRRKHLCATSAHAVTACSETRQPRGAARVRTDNKSKPTDQIPSPLMEIFAKPTVIPA